MKKNSLQHVRFIIGWCLFSILVVAGSLRMTISASQSKDISYAKYLKIISPVKLQLPPNADVSFVCQGDSRDEREMRKSGSLTECESRFVMAQSILAPHHLAYNLSANLTVGDFDSNFDYRRFADANHLQIVAEFSGGIVLFKR